jgi:hypothetical protein
MTVCIAHALPFWRRCGMSRSKAAKVGDMPMIVPGAAAIDI